MPRKVCFDRAAIDDLKRLFDWIAEGGDFETARAYFAQIEERCLMLDELPNRGRIRRRARSPIRSISFRRKATILYRVGRSEVVILRILPRGRDADAIARRSR